MALIAMAVWDTDENKRTDYTIKTIDSLIKTVDFRKHRLVIVDNNSCAATQKVYQDLANSFRLQESDINIPVLISLPENIGTARAINKAWAMREPGEHAIKLDNDVVIHQSGWIEDMEECIRRQPLIGQIGLKRKDCWEHPEHESPEWRSKLMMIPHEPGEKWLVVEKCKHIIGTCVMHSSSLLDEVGFMFQPTKYGHDDVLMSWRSHLAGFVNVHMPHIPIDHIDPGDTPYQKWKEDHSGKNMKLVSDLVDQYISKQKSIYYGPDC